MKNRNETIDFFKYIASLLIIAIHSDVFLDINETLNFCVVNVICRLAVPFFAVCTGYFLAKRLYDIGFDKTKSKQLLKRQLKKLISIYAFWTIVYLLFSIPSWISTGWFSSWAFADYFIASVLSGSHYHLWYLLSLIYAIPLLFICLKLLREKYLIIVSVLLYIVEVCKYSYRKWMPNPIQVIFGYLDKVDAITTAIFLILPLMLLGAYISRKKLMVIKYNIIGLCASFILLTAEAFALRHFGQDKVSFILLTYPMAYFAFSLISQINIRINEDISGDLGAASLIVYCFHPIMRELLDLKIKNTLFMFLIVSIISTIVGLSYVRIKKYLKSR